MNSTKLWSYLQEKKFFYFSGMNAPGHLVINFSTLPNGRGLVIELEFLGNNKYNVKLYVANSINTNKGPLSEEEFYDFIDNNLEELMEYTRN